MKRYGPFPVLILFVFLTYAVTMIFSGCSKDLPAYEELVESGTLEDTVRKRHSSFFKTLTAYRQSVLETESAEPDSAAFKSAAAATDAIVEAMMPFPSTVESRVALDALSLAATDFATEECMTNPNLTTFRDSALLKPLFAIGNKLARTGDINDSAHLQLIRALRDGMGAYATEDMLVNCLTLVGITPSEAVLSACTEDTLVFKRVHDLLLYSRSLQRSDPPLWLLSGPWFTALRFEGSPTAFLSIVPVMVEDVPFLAFRKYTPGDVYAAVYDDPVPKEKEKWNAWLSRGDVIMKSLTFDRAFADRVRNCGLPTYDAHHFYDDYIMHAYADTTEKKFMIGLKKNRIETSAFSFTGMDSLTVTFAGLRAMEPDMYVTKLPASRTTGSSMQGDQYIQGKTIAGEAFMMPIGEHSQEYIDAYKKKFMPEFIVNQVPAGN